MKNLKAILAIGEEFLLNNFNKESKIYDKGERDFALDYDIQLEKLYNAELQKLMPNIPILGEELSPESIKNNYSGLFWAVDPIDGTVNYSRKLPEYGSSIALIYKGKPIVSGICFPHLNETYIAGKGQGAFLNGDRITVSNVDRLDKSILAFGDFSVSGNYERKNLIRYKYVTYYGDRVLRIRMPGTAALQLAWVASGKADISLTLGNNAWDVQGGVLLVRESGGEVFDVDGSDHNISSKYTFATNSIMKEKILLEY